MGVVADQKREDKKPNKTVKERIHVVITGDSQSMALCVKGSRRV